jgi:hypothetical protein
MSATIEIPTDSYPRLEAMLPAPHSIDVTIEDVAVDSGDQIPADHLPFRSVTYDSDRHELVITASGRDPHDPQVVHRVVAPTGVWLEIRDGVVHSLAVDSSRSRTILTFHPRKALGSNHSPDAPLMDARAIDSRDHDVGE